MKERFKRPTNRQRKNTIKVMEKIYADERRREKLKKGKNDEKAKT